MKHLIIYTKKNKTNLDMFLVSVTVVTMNSITYIKHKYLLIIYFISEYLQYMTYVSFF